ncbi:MAG: glycosyltransferase [Acidimicrobiia bacterium]
MPEGTPVVILGSHRAGTSAVAGLLSLAGLELGSVIPPASDNPRGFFESRAVVEANKRVLATMGRDWTCPPLRSDSRAAGLEIARAVEEIGRSDRPWGFKDPRTLFLLRNWAHYVPGFRFVGVYRPSAAVAASIERRNGFRHEDALRIAEMYTNRLRRLHEALGFPIVRFDSERHVFLDRMKELVDALDLAWDPEAVEQFVGDTRMHPSDVGTIEADVYLAEQAESPIGSVPSFTPATVVAAHSRPDMASGPVSPLDLGIAHSRRRRRLWDAAIARSGRVGNVIEISPNGSPWLEVLPGCDPDRVSRYHALDLPDSDVESRTEASHVIAPDLLDAVDSEVFARIVANVGELTAPDAVFSLSGYVADGVDFPADLYLPRADLTASLAGAPHLHHRDVIEAALLRTPWEIGHLARDPEDGDRTTVVLVKSRELRDPGELAPAELRSRLVALDEEVERLTEVEERSSDHRKESERAIAALTSERDGAQGAVRDLEARLEAIERELAVSQTESLEQSVRLRDLGAERDALQRSKDQASSRSKSLQSKLAATEKKLAAAEKRYDRLSKRRTVRMALAFAGLFRPLFRFVRGQNKPKKVTSGGGQVPVASTRSERQRPSLRGVTSAILKTRADEGPMSGPLVSMVILTRNGATHLERLFGGLQARTAYRSFEVIVVDNASDDDTTEVLNRDWGFPIDVIRNERNASFSEGCNQGMEAATGEYVLLLNNDVDPINPGWLGALVDSLEIDETLGAVGSLLVYPKAPEGANRSDLEQELTVQHRGIAFRWRLGTPIGYNLGRGEDPTAPDLTQTVSVPGVTAACMLVRTDLLRSLGGLDERFIYGFEDVDLNLRIRERGLAIALVGASALFHHEFGTQSDHGSHRQRAYRSANLQVFAEEWASRVSRTVQMSTLDGGQPSWTGERARKVAITLTRDDPTGGWGDWHTAHELGDAFAARGWDVVYAEAFEDRWEQLPDDIDLVISLLDRYDARLAPEGAITVAWIRNWTDRWIEQPWTSAFDVLVPSSQVSADLLNAAGLDVAGILPLATNPQRFHSLGANAIYECDYAFTGNHWGVNRALLNALDVAPGERFSIFGNGWESVGRAARYWRGPVPYDDLPLVYNAAKIVLDDTAGPTLPYGALNSRVFDALACGTLVITNNGLGSDEFFDGVLPAYSTREELRTLLNTYLGDPELRASTAAELQRMVLADHTYAARAGQFIDLVRDRLAAPRVSLKIGPPNHEEAERWGDTHFARALARSLGRRGCATSVDILPEWDLLGAQSADIVVHLRGLVPYVPKPGQINVLWIISHPDDVPDHECERYDLVLVASDAHAEVLRQRLSVPVAALLQASAFDALGDAEEAQVASDVLFVGNSRGVMRHGVAWSIERGIPIDIYGSDWEGLIDASHVVAEHLPNEQLAAAYRSAGVVLNDHWPGMRDYGFISNRVFDVLASGGFIISDSVAGIEGVFGDTVPTYDSAEDLDRLIRYYQEHPDERADLAARGQELVASEHSFDRRAEQLLSMVLPLWERRPHTVEDTGSARS